MVGCSENSINFKAGFNDKLLGTLLVSGYTITPILYFFWASGMK